MKSDITIKVKLYFLDVRTKPCISLSLVIKWIIENRSKWKKVTRNATVNSVSKAGKVN